MNHVYVISDTHLGHHNILKYQPNRKYKTIQEHDKDLISRWNARVRKQDTVIHCGDVAFSRESLKLLNEAKGIKRLILGNHDKFPIELYQEVFDSIYGVYEKRNIVFTHIPVILDIRWEYNVHGHIHNKERVSPKHFNANIDAHNNLGPIKLTELLYNIK